MDTCNSGKLLLNGHLEKNNSGPSQETLKNTEGKEWSGSTKKRTTASVEGQRLLTALHLPYADQQAVESERTIAPAGSQELPSILRMLSSGSVDQQPLSAANQQTAVTVKEQEVFVKRSSGINTVISEFPVYPISVHGQDYPEINANEGLDPCPDDINPVWRFGLKAHPSSEYQNACEWRLSKVLTECFANLCKAKEFSGGYCWSISVFCHHFVCYIAFGEDHLKTMYDNNWDAWFKNLSNVDHLEFQEADLQWGDIVKLYRGGSLIHTAFYIGNGKYVSKHESRNIYIQNLEGIKREYPSDSLGIIRVPAERFDK